MGLLNKLMGLGGAGSDAKKEQIREIFNAKVPDGASYTVFAGMNLVYEKKLLKEIRYMYNYIIGYRDGADPEIVIMSIDSRLADPDEPIHFKKSETVKAEFLPNTSQFSITSSSTGDKPVIFAVIASSNMEGFINVSYMDEYMPFYEFFQNRFAK